jgi:hypothetical protein
VTGNIERVRYMLLCEGHEEAVPHWAEVPVIVPFLFRCLCRALGDQPAQAGLSVCLLPGVLISQAAQGRLPDCFLNHRIMGGIAWLLPRTHGRSNFSCTAAPKDQGWVTRATCQLSRGLCGLSCLE